MIRKGFKGDSLPVQQGLSIGISRLDRTAMDNYSVITEGEGCIPFLKWEEMEVGGLKN